MGLDFLPVSVVALLLGVGAISTTAYVFHAKRTPAPILDLTLLALPTFRASIFGGFLFRLGIGALRPDGHLLAVHWRHPVADYPRSGDEVHLILAGHPGLARLVGHREPDFVAEVYARADGRRVSVAEAGGLV